MIYIILAIAIFILTVVIHECVHYIVARMFGRKAFFKWIPSKEKNTIGIFGWLPGVRFEVKNSYEMKWISLSPLPFNFIGFFCFFIVLFYGYWSDVVWDPKTYLILVVTIIFSLIITYEVSRCDIKDYYKYKNPVVVVIR